VLIYLLYLNTFVLKLHFYRAYQIIDLQNSATADKPFGIKIREETILKAAVFSIITSTNSLVVSRYAYIPQSYLHFTQ